MIKLLITISCSAIFTVFGSSETDIVAKRRAEIRANIARHFENIPLKSKDRITAPIYISGDAFRSISKHIFDETDTPFDVNNVKFSDTVFVSGNLLELFFEYVHHKIKYSYILITHNSDISFPGDFHNYLDDPKIKAWLTVNPGFFHPKLHALPIGFQNHHWNTKRNSDIARALANKNLVRSHLLLMNFRTGTNMSERGPVFDLFSGVDYCYCPETNQSFYDYLKDLHCSKYCLSPFGNGKDCHRVYEALLMGCIPIVKSSELDQLYKDLPILVVSDWKEINKEFLNHKHKDMMKSLVNKDFLTIDFWQNKIRNLGGNTNIL